MGKGRKSASDFHDKARYRRKFGEAKSFNRQEPWERYYRGVKLRRGTKIRVRGHSRNGHHVRGYTRRV